MARTTVKDFFTTEKGHVNNAITFIHKGDIKKTFVSLNDLHKYNAIDTFQCVFGANTDISFQYSIVVSLTDYIGIYEKAPKKANSKTSKIKCNVTAKSRLYTLASYGWKINIRKDGKIVLTTPYQNKLTSFRRIMDGNENYFNFEYISVNRFRGKELLNSKCLNHDDIIKACQNQNRNFAYKWISERVDKLWN